VKEKVSNIRKGLHIVKGSDSAAIDRLTNAEDNSLVVIVSTSRYPCEQLQIPGGVTLRRFPHKQLR
jgi:hypothetical protein